MALCLNCGVDRELTEQGIARLRSDLECLKVHNEALRTANEQFAAEHDRLTDELERERGRCDAKTYQIAALQQRIARLSSLPPEDPER